MQGNVLWLETLEIGLDKNINQGGRPSAKTQKDWALDCSGHRMSCTVYAQALHDASLLFILVLSYVACLLSHGPANISNYAMPYTCWRMEQQPEIGRPALQHPASQAFGACQRAAIHWRGPVIFDHAGGSPAGLCAEHKHRSAAILCEPPAKGLRSRPASNYCRAAVQLRSRPGRSSGTWLCRSAPPDCLEQSRRLELLLSPSGNVQRDTQVIQCCWGVSGFVHGELKTLSMRKGLNAIIWQNQ